MKNKCRIAVAEVAETFDVDAKRPKVLATSATTKYVLAIFSEVEAVPNIVKGNLDESKGFRFAIVVARYNESITSKLLSGAVETLQAHGIDDQSIDVAWVPGAWELPVVAARFAHAGNYAAVLCLGAVIRGETSHDQHINRQVSLSLGTLSVETGIPVSFGVLTCNSLEQAIHRSGGNVGNKGVECAEAALEMVSLLGKLPVDV